MCIDFDGHHSSGSSFVYVNDFCYYRNCLYTHRYKFSFEKKKTGKESQYMVLLPGLGSDPPIGSDRELGRDKFGIKFSFSKVSRPESPTRPGWRVQAGARFTPTFSIIFSKHFVCVIPF